MYPVKPAVLAFNQPVAAVCVSVTQAPKSDLFGADNAIAGNAELEVAQNTPPSLAIEQPVVEKTPQMRWQERATISRAYAKILRQGGSLG